MWQMKESNILLYETEDGKINVDVILKDETIWLTQKSMSELFDVNVPAINKHLTNIYEEKELDKNSTISKMEIVRKEGNRNVSRELEFYNLDAIIAVGYRVNSKKATKFRIWATKILKDYMIKGFVIDVDKMKNGPDRKIMKYDISIANNYLEKDELDKLNDLTNLFLDIAETEAKEHKNMTMNNWIETADDL